jgi:DnaJ-class molecular chaperone
MSSTDLELQRCPACRGKRDVMGAGMIYHKCAQCKGVGYIESPETSVEAPVSDEAAIPQISKPARKPVGKAGRKQKATKK